MRVFRRLLRSFAIWLALLLGVVVATYLALAAFNLNDEPLDADVQDLLNTAPPQIDPARNAYFAWIGVMGPAGETAHSWGRRWFQAALVADEHSTYFETPLALDEELRPSSVATKDLFCELPERCLDEVAAKPEEARRLLERERVTLDRADQAMVYPEFQEPWRPVFGAKSSFAHYPPQWHRLSSMRFALAVAENRHEEALDRLGREMAFLVLQLRGATSLVGKLIPIVHLRMDYQLLARYMGRYPEVARRNAARIAPLLEPLPRDIVLLDTALRTELRGAIRLFLMLPGDMWRTRPTFLGGEGRESGGIKGWLSDMLMRPFLLPGVSANEMYRFHVQLAKAERESGAAYREGLAAVHQRAEVRFDKIFSELHARNAVGRVLLVLATPNPQSYFMRRDDMLATRAIVFKQFQLVRQGKPTDQALAAAMAGDDLQHPFTGTGPEWDAALRRASFPAYPARKDKALVVDMGP